jgi:hypothetical protein
MKWYYWLGGAAVVFWIVTKTRPRYAGLVATGWGGGPTGFLPTVVNPGATVGQGPTPNAFGGPGVPYGPSRTTNQGSGT